MILEHIQRLLENEDYICSFFSASEESPTSRLLVSLGLDQNKRERILEVIAIESLIPLGLNQTKKSSPVSHVQFRVELPFCVHNSALNQVASLILFINRFIEVPGFELDELNAKVIYRYVWVTQTSIIDSILIVSILSVIILNLDLFAGNIETVADGRLTFNDLLSRIIDLADQSRLIESPGK